MAGNATDPQSEVLAWLGEDRTRGYRAASKRFGVPASTIKGWAQAARAGQAVPTPNARTRARAKEPDRPPAAPVTPADLQPWDPTTCTREQFLTDRIRACREARDQAVEQGHGGVARQWETTIGDYRHDLDQLREDERRRQEARGRVQTETPEELATRLMRSIPSLARVAPAVAREVWRELGRALGEWE